MSNQVINLEFIFTIYKEVKCIFKKNYFPELNFNQNYIAISSNNDGNKDFLDINHNIKKNNLEKRYKELLKDQLWYADI